MRHERRRPASRTSDRLQLEPRLLGVLLVLIVVLAGVGAVRLLTVPAARIVPEVVQSPPGPASAVAGDYPADPQSASPIVVYLTGAVADPGVRQLTSGDRIVDALDAAGGPLPEAALDSVNLAREVVDGEQIHLPTVDEAAAGVTAANPRSLGGLDFDCIDLNQAGETQLETLDGIGPALASRIVVHRQEQGPFSSNESLLEVTGIGAGKYAALEGQLCG